MTEQISQMFITGPEIIKTVTGEDVTFDELGGATTHAITAASRISLRPTKTSPRCCALLSYFPQNNLDESPRFACDDDPQRRDEALDDLVPDSPNKPYDMHEVVSAVLDYGEFFEIQPLYAQNILCGFGRIDGRASAS